MSTIDVTADIEISADPADIAAVMFDPQRASQWMAAVEDVTVIDPALVVGARVEHRGRMMGRDLAWTTQVDAVHFPHVLVLRIDEGLFIGTLRYDIQRSGTGSRVRIRTSGEPTMSFVPAALIASPLRTALSEDLGRLKAIVEAN